MPERPEDAPTCAFARDAGFTTYFCALPRGHDPETDPHAPHPSVGEPSWTGDWKEPE
jgi:hypothetical protein